jgi:hypothetical protein
MPGNGLSSGRFGLAGFLSMLFHKKLVWLLLWGWALGVLGERAGGESNVGQGDCGWTLNMLGEGAGGDSNVDQGDCGWTLDMLGEGAGGDSNVDQQGLVWELAPSNSNSSSLNELLG